MEVSVLLGNSVCPGLALRLHDFHVSGLNLRSIVILSCLLVAASTSALLFLGTLGVIGIHLLRFLDLLGLRKGSPGFGLCLGLRLCRGRFAFCLGLGRRLRGRFTTSLSRGFGRALRRCGCLRCLGLRLCGRSISSLPGCGFGFRCGGLGGTASLGLGFRWGLSGCRLGGCRSRSRSCGGWSCCSSLCLRLRRLLGFGLWLRFRLRLWRRLCLWLAFWCCPVLGCSSFLAHLGSGAGSYEVSTFQE
mmetsp:Transcript_42201/g.91965  ORF Transcript_42201/g.91965 Transcript_42201/m.91965 type:complete len:246 (-) Transcript_42201:52-789(-)